MRKFDEKGFGHFVYLKDVKLSKDGSKAAYVIEKANFNKDNYENTIVIRDLNTNKEMFIKDASSPRFSPDSKYLYYLKTDEKRKITEVYEVEISTMSERKIFEEKGIKDILPSPCGNYLLIVHNKELEDDYLYFIDEFPPWFDSRGFFAKKRNVYKVIDSKSGTVISEIEKKPFSFYTWHGNKLLLSEPKGNNPWINYKITIFDPKEEKEEIIFDGKDFVAVDSDGKNILFIGREKRRKLADHRFLYLWDGKKLKNLTEKFIYNNVLGYLMKDKKVVYTYDYRGHIIMALTDGEEKEDIFGESYWVNEVSTNGEKVVFIAEDETDPSELYVYDGIKVEKITGYNDKVVELYKPKKAHHFTFENLGFKLDGWYLKPDIEEGKKAPVVLFVHGGPKGMYGHRFIYEMQHLAAEGFYVVYTNPRGSTGYTEDFAKRVVQRTGLEDFQDIMKGLDKFFEIEKDADPERVGITGISYGGFMTNWAITQTDRFKAAVSENGISSWLTSHTFSDIGIYFDHELIGENPLKDDSNHKKLSPLYYAEDINTPLLIIHSLEDYRCPLDQSLMFYNVLKNMGKEEVYFALFKKGSHVHNLTATPKHRAKRYKLVRDFFYRKLVEQKEGFEYKPE